MTEPADKTLPEASQSFGEDEQVQLAKEGDEHDDGEESDEYDLADEGDSKDIGEEEEDDYEGNGDGNEEESQDKNPSLTAILLGDPNAYEEEEDDEDDEEEDDYVEEAPDTAIANGKKRTRDHFAEEESEEPEGKKAKA